MEAIVGLLMIGGLIWLISKVGGGKARALAKAKLAYRESLNQLKQTPTNPDLKERTLALGRAYSYLTRDKRGATTFDEVALSNESMRHVQAQA